MTATRTGTTQANDTPRRGGLARSAALVAGWLLGVAVLVLLMFAGIAIGARGLPWSDAWDGLFAYNGSDTHLIIRELRLPRTVLAVLVGAALAVAGALIQALTRNPLADPGILGVNGGAALFVAIAVGTLGLTDVWTYLWFGFLGAAVATVAVYALGSLGRDGGTPIRLTLAGVAVGAVLMGVTTGLVLLDPKAFDTMRSWYAGSVSGRSLEIAWATGPFIAVGLVLAFAVARSLDAVALGDDLARSLGTNIRRTRTVGVIAVTLLCGAAVAAAGPIGFVGLMVPHAVRMIVGPSQPAILAYSLVGGPILVLSGDIIGRVLAQAEVPVGIVTAFVGAPVLIVLVRRGRAAGR